MLFGINFNEFAHNSHRQRSLKATYETRALRSEIMCIMSLILWYIKQHGYNRNQNQEPPIWAVCTQTLTIPSAYCNNPLDLFACHDKKAIHFRYNWNVIHHCYRVFNSFQYFCVSVSLSGEKARAPVMGKSRGTDNKERNGSIAIEIRLAIADIVISPNGYGMFYDRRKWGSTCIAIFIFSCSKFLSNAVVLLYCKWKVFVETQSLSLANVCFHCLCNSSYRFIRGIVSIELSFLRNPRFWANSSWSLYSLIR